MSELSSDGEIERVLSKVLDAYIPKLAAAASSNSGGASGAMGNELDALRAALKEAQDRQMKNSEDVKALHRKEIETLKSTIAVERREAGELQQQFEKTLQTKYEALVTALQDRVKAEQEARMRRALDDVERSARIEAERSRLSFEIQQQAEVSLSLKFKNMISDLQKEWESEEAKRAQQLEEKLRAHYGAMIEHMEAQLQMALRIQDEADKQWMDDVEARNKQQIEVMLAFEEKCRRLYDTRLLDYIAKTDEQLDGYEDQLLEAGSQLASERLRYESRVRRLKLASSRWKIEYQTDIHRKYQELTASMEAKYMKEVEVLLESLADANAKLTKAQNALFEKEKEILEVKKRRDTDQQLVASTGSAVSMSARLDSLLKLWQGLGTPADERIQIMAGLLDSANPTPELIKRYELAQAKLTARLPIMQMLSRKQYLEYKVQFSSGADASLLPQHKIELSELQQNLDSSIRAFERQYGEWGKSDA